MQGKKHESHQHHQHHQLHPHSSQPAPESAPPLKHQILQIFSKLHSQIESLDTKVQLLIERHEGEFVHAYQNHVRKIKTDLESLKLRSDEQEKEMKDNNRVVFLEKQAMLFREESLKLYDRLQGKTQEAEYYKFRCRDLEKTNAIMQKEIRETLKFKKVNQAKVICLEEELNKCKVELQAKNLQIQNLTQTLSASYQPPTPSPKSPLSFPLPSSPHPHLQKPSKLSTQQKTTYNTPFRKHSTSHSTLTKDSQLKQWFLECLRAIKKEVASRKGNAGQISFEDVRDVRQFMMVDKLRLLEKFMESQKLMVWMYEKIFPTRSNQLKEYLSHRSLSINEERLDQSGEHKLTEQHKTAHNTSTLETSSKLQISLPKMNPSQHYQHGHSYSSHRAHQVSNRISFKQGKLKIVNF